MFCLSKGMHEYRFRGSHLNNFFQEPLRENQVFFQELRGFGLSKLGGGLTFSPLRILVYSVVFIISSAISSKTFLDAKSLVCRTGKVTLGGPFQ